MNDREYFDLTSDHIQLIRAMNVSWWNCEHGGPSIDPKRPYGNSNVHGDMVEILGWEPQYTDPEDPYDLEDEQAAALEKLHKETETALQVVLASGSFTPGRYSTRKYFDEWVLEHAFDHSLDCPNLNPDGEPHCPEEPCPPHCLKEGERGS